MLASIISGLIVAGTPAATPAATPALVEAGRADWDRFPALKAAPRALPTAPMVGHVADLLQRRECSLAGQSHRRFDITVPYLALVKPDGGVERVLVADMGCPGLETYVGSIVLQLAGLGDFRPTGQAAPRWYASKLNFNVQ
jgi:hypothetical protein